MHHVRFPVMALLVSALDLLSCRNKSKPDAADAQSGPSAPVARPGDDPKAGLDLVDELSRCEVDHGGVLIDLGSAAAHGVTGFWSLAPDASLVETERDGETWVTVVARSVALRFLLEEPTPAFVAMRVRGGLSRNVSVALDGKPLGVLPLIRGQARIVSTRATAAPLSAGAHTIEVRFGASG